VSVDFNYLPEAEEFRKEIRAWLERCAREDREVPLNEDARRGYLREKRTEGLQLRLSPCVVSAERCASFRPSHSPILSCHSRLLSDQLRWRDYGRNG
jgi:hypothetical protein